MSAAKNTKVRSKAKAKAKMTDKKKYQKAKMTDKKIDKKDKKAKMTDKKKDTKKRQLKSDKLNVYSRAYHAAKRAGKDAAEVGFDLSLPTVIIVNH